MYFFGSVWELRLDAVSSLDSFMLREGKGLGLQEQEEESLKFIIKVLKKFLKKVRYSCIDLIMIHDSYFYFF